MKRKINKLLIYSCIIFTALACGRYEDGPVLSFRSPEKRVAGLWEAKRVIIDELDQTASYQSDSVFLRFSVSGTRNELFISLVEENRSSAALSMSVLAFSDDHKSVDFFLPVYAAYSSITEPLFELIPALNQSCTWTINRLSVSEWWISTEYNQVSYELQLKKTEQYLLNP